MAALLLASCAVPGTGEDRPVTLTYWSWTSGSQELADRFNATHDHIRVTFEKVPAGTAGGYSKMFNAVKAGKAPDVVAVEYPQLPGFVTQQVLQPLDPYGVTDLGDQYPDWAWRQVALGGQVYGLPMNIGPTVMFYRTDLFAEYGLTPPTTWEEFRTTAETVAAEHPGVTLTNFGTNDAALLAGLAWQAGARWFDSGSGHWQVDATDEAGARFAGYWESLIDDGLVTARPTFAEQHVTQLQQGTSLTVLAAPWTAANIQRFAPDLAGRWGAAPLPAWPEGPASGNYGGSSSPSRAAPTTPRRPWSSSAGSPPRRTRWRPSPRSTPPTPPTPRSPTTGAPPSRRPTPTSPAWTCRPPPGPRPAPSTPPGNGAPT